MADRIQVIKWESPAGGGTQTDTVPTEINPNEDGLDARSLFLQNDSSADGNVEVSRDASNRMTFKDGENTVKTLTELLSGEGGSDDDQVDTIVAEGETFTVKDDHEHILFCKLQIDGEYIVNGESVVLCGEDATGEINTASNVGTGGVGIYKQKAGANFEFKKLNAGSSKVTITDDTGNNEVDVDIVPGNIAHQNLSGAGTNSHSQIDTHIASTSNPHGTDIGNIGSGTLAELNTAITDATLDDSSATRVPVNHHAAHESGGADTIKLDDLAAPDDNTDLNATTSAHGLCPKFGGGTTNFLRADGTWAAPPSSSSPNIMQVERTSSWDATNFSTAAAVPFDGQSIQGDTGITTWSAGAATRIEIETSGDYLVTAAAQLVSTTSGYTYDLEAWLRKNGTTELPATRMRISNWETEHMPVVIAQYACALVADDYLEFMFDHAGNLTGSLSHCRITIVKLY